MSIFKGSAVALVTPFKDGKIDFYALQKIIEFQIENGTKAILIIGTTGEASTMSLEEKENVIKFSKKIINRKVPLIVGTGSNCTQTAVKLSILAEELGADALLVVTPYYNKCTQNGLVAHYKAIASNVSVPIIAYNVPSRTGVNILPETVLKLAEIKNVAGIKEASGNMSQIMEILKNCPKDFDVYCGDDSLTFPFLCLGGSGVISVTANILPETVQALCENCFNKNFKKALKLHNKLLEINNLLFCEPNPIPVKFAIKQIGFDCGSPRLPLQDLNPKFEKAIKKSLKKFGFNN